MGIVPTLAQDPPVLPPEEQPVAPPPETVVPTLAQDPAPAQSAPVPSEAQDAPPPQGPVSGAINAVSNAVSNFVPDAIEDPLSGWVPDVAAVTTALGQGDIGGAVAPILDYANRPFEFGSGRQGERAASGQGQVPSPGEIVEDPSAVLDVVPGFWNTGGPGAWAVGSDIDTWAEQNPQAAADALAAGGGQAVYETWKSSGGLQTTPAGVDSPLDDEQYSGSVLDRAGQAAGQLGEFGGSVASSARQGALTPFLKGMVADIGNDPSFAAQVGLGVATGGLSAAGGLAGRRGLVGVAETLSRASTVGRRINEAADIALDPITNSIGATLAPAAKGIRNLGGALDYSTASREARTINKLGETVGEYLNATPRTIPAAATPPAATQGALPPALNGVAVPPTLTPQPSLGGAPLPSNTLYNPPATLPASRTLPAGRGDPYSRPMVAGGAPGVMRPVGAAPPSGVIPTDTLAVRGGVWRTATGEAVSQGGDIATSLRTTTRRIYDEMMSADPEQFWDRFDSVSHQADVDLGGDGFYSRWRGAMRQGLYLLDDWPEARVARQMPGVRLPDGSIDWQMLGQMAQAGDKDAQRAMGGKRQHDLFVHRIALSTDPDREVYNLLVTYHLDQHSGRFTGNQYGSQYWRQRAEQISEVLRDAGYTPSPQLLQRLASVNVGDLVGTELAGRTGTAAMRGQLLSRNGTILLHSPGGSRPIVLGGVGRGMAPTWRQGVVGPDGRWLQSVPSVPDATVAEFTQTLRGRLDALGLSEVGLALEPQHAIPFRGGQQFNRMIRIAADVSGIPDESRRLDALAQILDHEAIHAIRELGLFDPGEWENLVAYAQDPRLRHDNFLGSEGGETLYDSIARRYDGEGLDIDAIDEEVVAEMFRQWRAGTLKHQPVEGILQKISETLRAIVDTVRQVGAEKVMRAIDSGEFGKRFDEHYFPRENPAGMAPGIPTTTQQIMNTPPPAQPGVNVMPTPNQQRVKASLGYLSASKRQGIEDRLPDDAIMSGSGVPMSAQTAYNVSQPMPTGFKFNDGSMGPGTIEEVIVQTRDELDQWVEMANDPALQVGRSAKEFDRLSKKFALDGEVLDASEIAGPQNAHKRDLVVTEIMQAAADNALPKAQKANILGIETYQSFMDMRRRVQLYNWLNIPRFAVQQHVGNSIGAAVAGRPGTALSIFTNLRDYRAVNQQLNNPRSRSLFVDDLQDAMGGGRRTNVTQSNRAMLPMDASGNLEEALGPFGHMAKLIAPKGTVNAGKINDTITRTTIYTEEVFKGYRALNKDLPRATHELVQKYGLPYTQEQVNDSIQRFLAEKRVLIDGNTGKPHTTMLGRTAKYEPVYSAKDLNDWLRSDLPQIATPTSLKSSDPLELVVRRLGADTAESIKIVQQAAENEVNRVAFEWMPNNIDEVVSNFAMYHYWMTRAGGLYVQQMLKNPWAMAAYGRMMDDFEGQLEMLDGPDWMKGWFQFMNTPAGFTVWYSPTDLFSTLLTFADWQMEAGESPFDNLTWIGRARNHIPFLLNPLLDFAAYAIGAYGPDAQVPDLLGLNRPATMATDLLNLANAEGLLPGWVRAAGIGVDAQGNPVPLQPKKLTELYASVGNGISSALKDITGLRPVPIPNTAASQQRSIAYILEQNFRVDYPGLPQGDIDRKVTDALADPGSAEYQRAWRQQADMPFMTGDTPLPGWAEGAIRTVLSPIQMYSGTEQQFMDSTMKGYEPTGEIPGRNFPTFTMPDGSILTVDNLKQMTDEEQFNLSATVPGVTEWMDEVKFANNAAKYGASKTVEGRVLAEQYDAYFDAGDPTINAVKSVSNGIYFGNASEPVSVGGVTYSPEEIAGFDEDTRKALANQYRDENGATWDMIEQNDAARDAYLDANPNVAAYLDWKNAAYDHPGGEVGYIQEQMATNPAYADYMSRNNFDLQTGAVDYDHALSSDAFLAAQGIAPTLYEPISSPTMEPLPAPQMQTVTSTVLLDVYPGPDSTLAPFAQADTGFPMTLVEMDGNWAKITIGGQEGYVDAGYLQNAPGGYAPEGLTGAIGGVVNGGAQGIASLMDEAGSVVGTMFGGSGLSIKPSNEPGFATGQYGVMPAPDGMGIRSTPESDRSWMEDMIGGGHAIVTTDYKGTPPVGVSYEYQTGHGADGTTHAAYDISCDTGYNADGSSSCPGTPIMAPIAGSVVCAGYGQGTGGAMGSPACTYSQNTTINNPDGSPPAHTIVLDVGTDAAGNDLQLSFNHMGTSDLAPGQGIEPGDLLGGMGDTEGGPHVHLEAWGWCPSAGTYIIVDPALVVDGYYSRNAVC